MKTISYKKHRIEMYDSIENLPIVRFQKYNTNLLLDAGIGSDVRDFDQKLGRISQLIEKSPQSAREELANTQQLIRFIIGNTNPKYRSFVCMIHKINGRVITDNDLSDEGITKIIEELSQKRISHNIITTFLSYVKKKLEIELDTVFPSIMENAKTKELYTYLKRHTILRIQQIQGFTKERELEIKRIEGEMISDKVGNYFGRNGLETRSVKGFQDTCIFLMRESILLDPFKASVITFYQAIEVANKMIKERKKARTKKK